MRKIFLILAAVVVLSSCASNNLSPVTEERLNEMLAEIVERESRIITESDKQAGNEQRTFQRKILKAPWQNRIKENFF